VDACLFVSAYQNTGEIIIYPNPSYDKIEIEYNIAGDCHATYFISDLTGNILIEQKLDPGYTSTEIDLHTLSTGMYLISFFINNKGIHHEKISVIK
jgi:hypothetical protein